MNSKRKTIIAGNWKMNKTPKEAEALLGEVLPKAADASCEVVVCVPYVDLPVACDKTAGSKVSVGAQNLHFKASGAYTGEISAAMLQEIGVSYVVIGHSERREYFAETDATVSLKIGAALAAGLTPILCVGESLEQREQNIMPEHIRTQIKIDLSGVSAADMGKVVIAYEPIWAIGTGKTATSEQAQEVCKLIRDTLAEIFGVETAETVSILYGGSMNAKNAAELLAQPDIDGGLIGGASLKADDFGQIIAAAK
ncbi:MAG: triose-phosphate isomerase [Oscillospiraceae bacterium]|nr:triose-phosphate isomerase [Oscillospiraceae bacterium]